jgi:ankyrin repeat protein
MSDSERYLELYKEDALVAAANHQKTTIGLELIKSGKVNLNHQGKVGFTALMHSCWNSDQTLALELIKAGARVDIIDNDGGTALIYACKRKLFKVANAILETGNSLPGQVNRLSRTALIEVCDSEHYDPEMSNIALKIIQTGESNPDQIDITLKTGLLYASKNRMEDVSVALVKTGKSLPNHFAVHIESPFRYACSLSMINLAKELSQVIDLTKTDLYGDTPPMIAKKYGLESIFDHQ